MKKQRKHRTNVVSKAIKRGIEVWRKKARKLKKETLRRSYDKQLEHGNGKDKEIEKDYLQTTSIIKETTYNCKGTDAWKSEGVF